MEIIRMENSHNKSEGDRVVIPGSSRSLTGAVGPELDRTDNYGNQWLKPGFEYPPDGAEAPTASEPVVAPQG